MTRFRKIVTVAALIGCASSAIIPLSASARTMYYGKSMYFTSSYSYDDEGLYVSNMTGISADDGDDICFEGDLRGKLSGTNNCGSKFSTVSCDDHKAYVCEWNKNGTAKGNYGKPTKAHPAVAYANIDASFFTPTNTYHEGYTATADAYLCLWKN